MGKKGRLHIDIDPNWWYQVDWCQSNSDDTRKYVKCKPYQIIIGDGKFYHPHHDKFPLYRIHMPSMQDVSAIGMINTGVVVVECKLVSGDWWRFVKSIDHLPESMRKHWYYQCCSVMRLLKSKRVRVKLDVPVATSSDIGPTWGGLK